MLVMVVLSGADVDPTATDPKSWLSGSAVMTAVPLPASATNALTIARRATFRGHGSLSNYDAPPLSRQPAASASTGQFARSAPLTRARVIRLRE